MKLIHGSLHRVIELPAPLEWKVKFMSLQLWLLLCCQELLSAVSTPWRIFAVVFSRLPWSEGFPSGVWILLKVPMWKLDQSQRGSGSTGPRAWGTAADCWVWSRLAAHPGSSALRERPVACSALQWGVAVFSSPGRQRASARCAACSLCFRCLLPLIRVLLRAT